MSNKNNVVPEDQDEFMEWMRATSRPTYAKPGESDSKAIESKSSDKPMDNFDIDNINMNILGLEDEVIPTTSTTDADKAIEAGTSLSDEAKAIKERMHAKQVKIDADEAKRVVAEEMAERESDSTSAIQSALSTNATIMTEVDTVNEVCVVNKEEEVSTDKKSPQKKPTRISARMRRATLGEFHDSYLIKTSTKDGSPITIAPDLIKMAYRICALSGDHKARPTYLINNLLREIFKELEPDIAEWSKLD
jgi:phage tail tube protein FII